MDSWMCPDCGERVDHELEMPDGSCNWCAIYDAVDRAMNDDK